METAHWKYGQREIYENSVSSMNVIVTNAKNRIAYAIIKSLGEKGIDVFTSDFARCSMTFSSRYSKGHFLYPSPFKNEAGFIESIIRNVHCLNAHVLIPVFEETFLLSKFKEEVSKHIRIVIPDYNQILIAHNKDKWLPIAKKLGIPVPKTYTITELKNQKKKIKILHFPVLIKPNQGGGAWGVLQVNSATDLDILLKKDTYIGLSWERFFVQEKLNGHVHCVAMLFNQGKLRAHIGYKQLRDFPVSGGQATLRVSLEDPQTTRYFRKLLEELNWHGVCQADFLVEKKTGIPYLIDINPRFWGSLIQGIASGVDFPYLVYKIAIDGDVDPVKGFKEGIKTRWIWGDLRTLPQAFRNSNNKLEFLKEYFLLFHTKMLYDDFCLRDPLPFFIFGLDSLIKIIKQRTLHPSSHDSLKGIWE
jgi:predicted ATP-grasp superfamily ATP-dependent carboligase